MSFGVVSFWFVSLYVRFVKFASCRFVVFSFRQICFVSFSVRFLYYFCFVSCVGACHLSFRFASLSCHFVSFPFASCRIDLLRFVSLRFVKFVSCRVRCVSYIRFVSCFVLVRVVYHFVSFRLVSSWFVSTFGVVSCCFVPFSFR